MFLYIFLLKWRIFCSKHTQSFYCFWTQNNRRPSRNSSFFKLTSVYHRFVPGLIYHVTSLRHLFRCSALIPDEPLVCPICSIWTDTVISYRSVGPSGTSAGWTSIVIITPYGGATCRGLPSGYSFFPDPPWLGVAGGPWPDGTTSILWPMLPSSVSSIIAPQSSTHRSYPPSIFLLYLGL